MPSALAASNSTIAAEVPLLLPAVILPEKALLFPANCNTPPVSAAVPPLITVMEPAPEIFPERLIKLPAAVAVPALAVSTEEVLLVIAPDKVKVTVFVPIAAIVALFASVTGPAQEKDLFFAKSAPPPEYVRPALGPPPLSVSILFVPVAKTSPAFEFKNN